MYKSFMGNARLKRKDMILDCIHIPQIKTRSEILLFLLRFRNKQTHQQTVIRVKTRRQLAGDEAQ